MRINDQGNIESIEERVNSECSVLFKSQNRAINELVGTLGGLIELLQTQEKRIVRLEQQYLDGSLEEVVACSEAIN